MRGTSPATRFIPRSVNCSRPLARSSSTTGPPCAGGSESGRFHGPQRGLELGEIWIVGHAARGFGVIDHPLQCLAQERDFFSVRHGVFIPDAMLDIAIELLR